MGQEEVLKCWAYGKGQYLHCALGSKMPSVCLEVVCSLAAFESDAEFFLKKVLKEKGGNYTTTKQSQKMPQTRDCLDEQEVIVLNV